MKVLIIGCGNIGYRHLEALISTQINLDITICDQEIVLENLKKTNILRSHCNYFFEKKIEELKDEFYEIIIVATSSRPRFNILKEIKNKGKFIILEKILFTKFIDYFQCLSDIESLDHIYVNTWYHLLNEFNLIKNVINSDTKKIEVIGSSWGLACNSVHYINLFEKLCNIKFTNINNSESFVEKVFKSKREGYSEIYGKVSLLTQNKKFNLILEDRDFYNDSAIRERLIKVYNDNDVVSEFKYDGKSIFDFQKEISIKTKYMSQVLIKEYKNILKSNYTNLPILKESIRQHLLIMYFVHNIKLVENNIFYT